MSTAAAGPPTTRQLPRRHWPLRYQLPEMGALPTAPRTARAHVRDVLGEWGLTRFEDTAVLIASELVTNVGAPRGALSYPRLSRDELTSGIQPT